MESWPLVLAGPIVRRVEPGLVCVWVALKEARSVRLSVWQGVTSAGSASGLFSGQAPLVTGDAATVRTLLARGASVDAPRTDGRTALTAAALGDHLAVARLLVDAGADPDPQDGERNNALLVTGETSFHTCLEAEALGIALLLPGHYASERFAVQTLADVLAQQFSKLECWASQDERDPLAWI